MSTIAENIAGIRAQMAEAAKKAGRDPSEILLCAATKMNDAERVKEAVAAGVDCTRFSPQISTPAAIASRTREASFIFVAAQRRTSSGALPLLTAASATRCFMLFTFSAILLIFIPALS